MVFQLTYVGGTSRHGAPHRSRQSRVPFDSFERVVLPSLLT